MAAAEPVPLKLPAILVNPRNKGLAQVEAFNAQQRDKAAARRQAHVSSASAGVGKRVLRRRENAAFQFNPHIHPPSKSDLLPSAPPHTPSFPLPAPHNSSRTPIAPSIPGSSIPDPESTRLGGFTTSLKGIRKALRGRGRRAEVVVLRAEAEIRDWTAETGWKVIDHTLVEHVPDLAPSSESQPRTLPHSPRLSIPPFVLRAQGGKPAITALAQTPAHQIWHVPDPFDRWIIHLLCRYWDLVSWSAPAPPPFEPGQRLTHIVRPEIAFPRIERKADVPGMMTPDPTDLSASAVSDSDAETETETDHEEYKPQPLLSPPSSPVLRRTLTTDSDDYLYPASDESDWSETDSISGPLADSLVLEPADGGWQTVNSVPPPRPGLGARPIQHQPNVDKPSFFDYLYGA